MRSHPDTAEAFKRVQAATIRALAEDRELAPDFGPATAVHAQQVRVPLPGAAALNAIRGVGDYIALKRRFHDLRIHRLHAPRNNPARDVFTWLEDARLSAVGACRWPGVALNLDASLEAECKKAFLDLIESQDAAPLGIALGLLAREHLSGRPLPCAAENVARFWRHEVQERAAHVLRQMQRATFDQARYAEQALRLMSLHGLDDRPGDDPQRPVAQEPDADEQAQAKEGNDPQGQGAAREDEAGRDSLAGTAAGAARGEGLAASMAAGLPDLHLAARPSSAAGSYRIFTNTFDRVVHAEDLCDRGELDLLRAQLDRKLTPLRPAGQQLANRLQRRLLALQKQRWMTGLDEGMLDYGRLASIVADSMNANVFKHEQDVPAPGAVLTMLIDSSGSMRGHPIATAAMCADIFGRALARCAVKVEILGFTTQDWRGGQSRRRWLSSSQPAHPGRLNDLLHVIYKGADEPWRQARRRLGLFMREDLLKENVDGEALLWAHQRLLARKEARRILMVISDGMPVDTATLRENGEHYLQEHLSQVIAHIENKSPIELVAIGIGHDVTRYYRRAVRIRRADELGTAMLTELAALFGTRGKR